MVMSTLTDETSNRLGISMLDLLRILQLLIVESWFNECEQMPLNRSHWLPAPYKRLIDGLKQKNNDGLTGQPVDHCPMTGSYLQLWSLTSGLYIFYLPIFAAPSGPPLNVALTDITSTSMTVSWDPPVEPNGKIVGYKVIYYEKDNQETKTIPNVPGQRYTIENLNPFRIYRISVACKSSGGIGPLSVAIENQTLPGGESFTCIIVGFVQSAQ